MKWLSIIPLCAVTACGPLAQGNPIAGFAQGVINTAAPADGEFVAPSLTDTLNRDFIEAQPNNLLLASVISRETTAVLVQAGNNGSKVTWFSPDGISVTLDNGVVVATRGLGADLMGADASGVNAAFAREANYTRTNGYLTGLDQIETRTFECSMVRDRTETITIYDVSYDTTVFVETCQDGQDAFRNSFWRASNGVIWQARQWISADIGYLGYQRL